MAASAPDVEAAALLPKFAPVVKPTREWRGHWAAVWGKLAPVDLISALLTIKVPFAAAAWNNHRALERGFFREITMWLCVVLTYLMLGVIIQSGFMATCGAPGGPDGLHDHKDFHHGLALTSQSVASNGEMLSLGSATSIGTSTNANTNIGLSSELDHDDHRHHDMWSHHHETPFIELPHCLACHGVWVAAAGIVCLLILSGSVIAHLATSRKEIRTRYGIPGSLAGDVALWTFCAPCALAQETRTLMHANVSEGMWYGPIEPLSAPAPLYMS